MMEREEHLNKRKNKNISLLMIVLIGVFFVLGFDLGFYFSIKIADNNDNVINDIEDKEAIDGKEEQDEQEANTISQELLAELGKKVEVSKFLTLSMVLGDELYDGNYLDNVYNLNLDNSEYMAFLTYQYYLESSGNEANKWTSEDMSDGPCFEQSQNGYCYIIDKEEILKYDKMLFNLGENLFLGDSYILLKDDKFYVTDVPYLGGDVDSVLITNAVSAVKNIDNSISYVASYNYKLTSAVSASNINVKYTFKLNDNNEYYLYSAVKI